MKDLRTFRNMPTVMSTSAELVVIRALRRMPLDYLVAHRDLFTEIVDNLDGSHMDSAGGAFGLTLDNEAEFHEFASWLREVGPLMGWPDDMDWALDVTFEDMATTFPSMRSVAASGPQPRSPIVLQLAQRIKETDPLKITEATAADWGVRLQGPDWRFSTSPGWRVLNPDRTVAFAWTTPDLEDEVAGLIGLYVVDIAQQSQATAADPTLLLSDGRCLEVFSGNPLSPWVMRLPNGAFTGAPAAPEWV